MSIGTGSSTHISSFFPLFRLSKKNDYFAFEEEDLEELDLEEEDELDLEEEEDEGLEEEWSLLFFFLIS